MPQTYTHTAKDLRRYIWDAMKYPGACQDGDPDSLSRPSGSVKPTSARFSWLQLRRSRLISLWVVGENEWWWSAHERSAGRKGWEPRAVSKVSNDSHVLLITKIRCQERIQLASSEARKLRSPLSICCPLSAAVCFLIT